MVVAVVVMEVALLIEKVVVVVALNSGNRCGGWTDQ